MRHLINHVYGKEENSINLNLSQENAQSVVAAGSAQERASRARRLRVGAEWNEISPSFILIPGVMTSPGFSSYPMLCFPYV